MGGSHTQGQAEKMLRNFDIEKDKIRCTDASALEALIPYLRRLLQLFPEINENTKHALSADGVRSRVYQVETRRHVERIGQSPFDFKTDALSLRDFVRSDREQILQLQMVIGDEWIALIKVYQSLQKTGSLIEGQYTVLTLERLLSLNRLMDISTLIQSTVTPKILLMACDTNELLDEESEGTVRNLFNIIKQTRNVKIILTTRSDGTTLHPLQQIVRGIFGKGFVTRVEHLAWSDLTTESQEKLLKQIVRIQGNDIALNELISIDSPVTKLLSIGTLIEGKRLQIV